MWKTFAVWCETGWICFNIVLALLLTLAVLLR